MSKAKYPLIAIALITSAIAAGQDTNSEANVPTENVTAIASLPEEIIIVGKVSGPPLWQVTNGDNTLWIFGLLSPLPKSMEWESKQVEEILATSQGFLKGPDADINLPNPIQMLRMYSQYKKQRKLPAKQTLADFLTSDEYQRLLTLINSYAPKDNELLYLRPSMAATQLQKAAAAKLGLENGGNIGKKLRELAKKHHVPVIESEAPVTVDWKAMTAEIASTPIEREIPCLNAVIEGLTEDLAAKNERALQWAYGQMQDLYDTHHLDAAIACSEVIDGGKQAETVKQTIRSFWLQQATQVLHTNTTTFAVLSLDELLKPEGLLRELEKLGFSVVSP